MTEQVDFNQRNRQISIVPFEWNKKYQVRNKVIEKIFGHQNNNETVMSKTIQEEPTRLISGG